MSRSQVTPIIHLVAIAKAAVAYEATFGSTSLKWMKYTKTRANTPHGTPLTFYHYY